MKSGVLGVVGALVLAAVLFGGCAVSTRNQLVTAEEGITASWAQVENVLQRRADLIPNLVNTVKGIAKQEKDVLLGVTEARAKVGGARSIPEKINANQQLESALSRLLVVVERYPEIKSNQNFMALQDELSGTENRIAVERKRYNDAVQTYNVLVRRFPGSLFAGLFGFEKKDIYFQAAPEKKDVPSVDFTG